MLERIFLEVFFFVVLPSFLPSFLCAAIFQFAFVRKEIRVMRTSDAGGDATEAAREEKERKVRNDRDEIGVIGKSGRIMSPRGHRVENRRCD